MLNVFQPILTDDQVNRINSGDYSEEFEAYARVTCLFSDINQRVRNAIEADLYSHKWAIRGDAPEHAFYVTNAPTEDGEEHPSVAWSAERRASVSVGDIIVIDLSTTGWVCLPEGWAELPDDLVKALQYRAGTKCLSLTE